MAVAYNEIILKHLDFAFSQKEKGFFLNRKMDFDIIRQYLDRIGSIMR